MKAANLEELKNRQARRDREDAALKAYVKTNDAIAAARFATSLSELRGKLGEYGRAAVIDARWAAVTLWMMHDYPVKLPNPLNVTYEAINLCREASRVGTGLPHPEGRPQTAILYRLAPELQQEARKVASDAFRAWKRAGAPYLKAKQITGTHQYFLACMRRANETKDQ